MITAAALMEKFKYALDNKWGYIWGTAGILWTKARQQQLEQTTDSNRANGRKYGSKWIGHYVADCSGLFTWAFKELGGTMYHGSNTMFLKYCANKGELKKGKRTDGATLKPGTAVFVWNGKTYSHVGLFMGDGNGTVIEAKGTVAGVTTSNITDSKWSHWGELTGVSFSADAGDDNTGFPDTSTWHPTIRRGSKGDDVKLMQTMLDKLGYNLGSCGIDGDFGSMTEKALKEFQRDHKLNQDGACGPLTWDALEKAYDSVKDVPKEKTYSVTIHGLDKTQAEALKNNYPGSTISEE